MQGRVRYNSADDLFLTLNEIVYLSSEMETTNNSETNEHKLREHTRLTKDGVTRFESGVTCVAVNYFL